MSDESLGSGWVELNEMGWKSKGWGRRAREGGHIYYYFLEQGVHTTEIDNMRTGMRD